MTWRPTRSEWLLTVAQAVATRGSCALKQVGAVVTNPHGRIIATGYNGPPARSSHCSDQHPCRDDVLETHAPESYIKCMAVHAEVNALLTAGEQARGGILAVTVSPCRDCAKVIVNAGISAVYFGELHRLFYEPYGASDILRRAGVDYEHTPRGKPVWGRMEGRRS